MDDLRRGLRSLALALGYVRLEVKRKLPKISVKYLVVKSERHIGYVRLVYSFSLHYTSYQRLGTVALPHSIHETPPYTLRVCCSAGRA